MMDASRLIIAILIALYGSVSCQIPPMLQPLYQMYLKEGIPFRENRYLGNKPILREYDFIVIGSGPGGSVVTNRLTENPEWKVLLLEAGTAESIFTDIPATVGDLQMTGNNWHYRAERTENACLAVEDQRCPWPRGKAMGGTSVINYMIYTRGNRKDYDGYAAAGNTGWSYEEVFPYFLKCENNGIPEYARSKYHSTKGYLSVERVRHKTELLDAFLEAGKELGHNIVDYNEPAVEGFSRIQATTKQGKRVSAAKAYINPIKNRPNMHVAILSTVSKVLIDPATKKAYGVEFHKNGKVRRVLARKEVILSAGALNSPQVLMLSGVGPKEHLEELGIPVIQDARVGDNLHEHYVNIGLTFLVNKTNSGVKGSDLTLAAFLDWFQNGLGILTLPGGVEGIAYMNTKYNTETDYPDLEFIFCSGSLISDNGRIIRKTFGIRDDIYEEVYGDIKGKDSWTVLPMLLHPKTIGKVRLASKNPKTPPKFYFNYFEDPSDLKTMIEGLKLAIKLSETEAFRKFGTRLNPKTVSACSKYDRNSDEYWECFARYFTATIHHQCGTCKMGPRSDPTAVVDPELRVYGIEGLRVVDASILPKVPGAHLYGPTLMIAEKASDMIKSYWLTPDEQKQFSNK